jgi:mannan endo-1,6-alpha-mannosidase
MMLLGVCLNSQTNSALQGNDDQAFWALAVMSALEYQFPEPGQAPAAYLDVAVNAFNNIVGRWDTTTCDGGLKWQIYPENSYGYNYKNAISNGCAFALGARLARYTGNQTYADWADKIYDWTRSVGMITDIYEVFDGTDDKKNCAEVADETQWTYNNAMFLHGSAFMFDYTNGGSVWKERTAGFLKHAELLFFRPFENATDIMYEWACETGESGRHCNLDQQSFKAYLSRFLAKTAAVAPFTKDTITKYLKASAVGAAKSCSGGVDGATCGSKWYTGSWDGTSGVGQQLAALEVTQALLSLKEGIVPARNSEQSKPKPSPSASTTIVPKPSSAPNAKPTAAPPSDKPALPSDKPALPSDKPASSSAAAPATSVSTKQANVPSQTTETTPASSTGAAGQPPVEIKTSIIPSSSAPALAEASSTDKDGVSTSCSPTTTVTVYVPSTSSSCTGSTTVTVYVPPPSQTSALPDFTTLAPVAPPMTTLAPIAPPANNSAPANSSKPSPTGLPEFDGAGASIKVTASSLLGAVIIAAVAGLL